MHCWPRFLVFSLLIFLTGCNTFRWGWLKKEEDNGSVVRPTGPVPTTAAIVDYLNDNAGRVQSLRVEDLSGSAGEGLQSLFSFSGVMMAEQARAEPGAPAHPKFRMGLKALGNPVADLGSNDQEFWFWLTRGPLMYCSYKDFEEGRAQSMPIPIQPEWVMQVLGLGPYGPADRYQQENDARSIRLVERVKSPQGTGLKKVMVFRWPPVKAPKAQISDFLLIDEVSGKEICSAHIVETQVDRGTGAILPRHVEIRCLEPNQKQETRMTLRLNGVVVNPNLPQTAFVRQPMRGVESIDLSRAVFDNRVQRTKGSNP
jgi:hypothetical protein